MAKKTIGHKIVKALSRWLLKEAPPHRGYLCDFPQICTKILPGDVLLIEGRSRVSSMVKAITQSPWSHAILYIGRLQEIQDVHLQNIISQWHPSSPASQLIIESELGYGTIVSDLSKYQNDHIRILRPNGLSVDDTQKIIAYAASRLGANYNLRHVIDLARIMLPWRIFPKKLGYYIFEHSDSQPLEDICSSMIAETFQSIQFPILPLVTINSEKHIELIERNPRLFTPSDFDFSPYFSVIKYPIFPVDEKAYYHHLPWKKKMMSNDSSIVSISSQKD